MLSNEELRIEQWEREGLLFFMDKLLKNEYQLNMNRAHTDGKSEFVKDECGSVACLGGNMMLKHLVDTEPYTYTPLATLQMRKYVGRGGERGGMDELFWPNDWFATDWELIPSEYVGHAINNFLNTGSPQWGMLSADYTSSRPRR